MPWTTRNKQLMTIALVGIVGYIGSLTSCASPQGIDSVEPLPTSINLERTIYFRNASGDATQVQPGTYEVSTTQGKLLLTGETPSAPLLLDTHSTTHEETVRTATPLSFSEQDDEHVVMLLFPDKTALAAEGSYSGIQERAIRRSKKRRISPAIINRQFNRAMLVSRARPTIQTHFTLRVPVQLTNLSPDINQLKIKCQTQSGHDATAFNNRIGEGDTIAHVTNRQFNRTVVVKFNASQGKEPEDADSYYCGITFHKPGIGFRQPGKYGTPLGNQKPAWLVSADGTPFRIHAQGGVN